MINSLMTNKMYYNMLFMKEINTLLVCVFCMFISIYGFPPSYHIIYNNILLSYFLCDSLFLDRLDMVVHHFYSICLLQYDRHSCPLFYQYITTKVLSCEISTIFLTLFSLCKRYKNIPNMFINCLQICFVVTFMYFRIFTMTRLFLFDPIFEEIISKQNTIQAKHFGLYVAYSLLNLNYYWFYVIYKKILFKSRTINN